ncbi:retrovirus-related Pol polyprotein from transposon 17.6 [Trichonephila clavipes]|nr:retrovirus-related Pol polyprotein from transposon 17.6 [Trichonephila clavipes]
MPGGNVRLLHVNKMREYKAGVQTVVVVYDIDDEFGEIYELPTVPAAEKNDEALDRVKLDHPSGKQQNQLQDLLHRHRSLFSVKIKRAKVGEHVIKLKVEEETMKLGIAISDQKFNTGIRYFLDLNTGIPVLIPAVARTRGGVLGVRTPQSP